MMIQYLRSDTVPFSFPEERISRDEFVDYGIDLVQLNVSRHRLIHPFYDAASGLMEAKTKAEMGDYTKEISKYASLTGLEFTAREFMPVIEYVTGTLLHVRGMGEFLPAEKDSIIRASLPEKRQTLLFSLNRLISNVAGATSWEHARARMKTIETKMQENDVTICPREGLYLLLPFLAKAQASQGLSADM